MDAIFKPYFEVTNFHLALRCDFFEDIAPYSHLAVYEPENYNVGLMAHPTQYSSYETEKWAKLIDTHVDIIEDAWFQNKDCCYKVVSQQN